MKKCDAALAGRIKPPARRGVQPLLRLTNSVACPDDSLEQRALPVCSASPSRRCTPEISLGSCSVAPVASSSQFLRLPARQAPSTLIRPTRIAGYELASLNRVVRFQATYVGVRAGRRRAEHTGHAHCCRDAADSQQLQTSSPDAGLWARTPGRFHCVSRKAAAAIPRVDFRRRVLVVRTSIAFLAVR